MKLVKIRLLECMVTLNEALWPIRYSHSVASLGLRIEIRMLDRASFRSVIVYATKQTQYGATHYAGRSTNSYSESEMYKHLIVDVFQIAKSLSVPPHHLWPLVEQFPAFSEDGVKIDDAKAFEQPIRDLLARGASDTEVMTSLGIDRCMYEFVLGEKLALVPFRQRHDAALSMAHDSEAPDSIGGW